MLKNPIAHTLGFSAVAVAHGQFAIDFGGRIYDYKAERPGVYEGIYRRIGGHGSSNACFSVTQIDEKTSVIEHQIGVYFSGGSHTSNPRAVKRDEATSVFAHVRDTLRLFVERRDPVTGATKQVDIMVES